MPDPTYALVIFDNDGVLIDSEKLAARGNAELLTGLGYPMTAEDCERRFAGLSDRDMVAELRAEGAVLPDDFIEQMYAISEHAFLTELEPITGVRSVVKLAQSRAAIAVASNAPRANVLRNLITTGYDDLIPASACFSGLDVPRPKPAPDLHRAVLSHFDLGPERALVIEDSPAGASGARAAGVDVIGVLYAVPDEMKPQRREAFAALGALAVLDSPAELAETLRQLLPEE